MRKDPDETYSLKEKLAVTAVLLLPVALAVVAPRNFGETWPLSPYCVGGEKTVYALGLILWALFGCIKI